MSGLAHDGSRGRVPSVGVVVPAAGLARRLGGRRKLYVELAGAPVLLRALRPLLEQEGVRAVVVALPADEADDPPEWLRDADERITVVPGGETRRDSVWAALQALPPELDVVVVHDGARPLVSPQVVARCIEVAGTGVGAVAGFPAVDTLKRVDAEGEVIDTPDRASLWHAQTPQAFPRSLLMAAYERALAEGWPATDDSALVERAGGRVVMVQSSPTNLKITHPEDLEVAHETLTRGQE